MGRMGCLSSMQLFVVCEYFERVELIGFWFVFFHQAAKSEIAFGFMEYAKMRWNEFQRLSAEIGFAY
jgi:hypothetical protein